MSRRMERSWLINSRGLAKKVKNAACSPSYQIKDCGASRECPNCHCRIDNSDVSPEWPGLPAGVKFEPSDEELVVHLAAKCDSDSIKPHMFIDEFIPTLEGEGIYCDHPENLPGAKKDGSSIHFFHKIINAYATGQRKRRKVQNHGSTAEQVRWHKTGKSRPVIENGLQKGWRKIMVLYETSKKGSKPDKTKWVMHQYHLGTEEDEKEGEYVVSKIYYKQPKQPEIYDNNSNCHLIEESDTKALQTSPMTPNSNPPIPPRHGKSILTDDIADNTLPQSSSKEEEGGRTQEALLDPQTNNIEAEEALLDPQTNKEALLDPQTNNIEAEEALLDPQTNNVEAEDDMGYPAWLAGESQAIDNSGLNSIDDSLLCKERLDSGCNYISNTDFTGNNKSTGENIAPCGISDLENLELDTPPDFHLPDLQFCSQESILDWLDRF